MKTKTLKNALADWTDVDVAAYGAAIALGVMDASDVNTKHVFWSDHDVGILLVALLDNLVSLEIVERRPEPDLQYRWNVAFRGSWSERPDPP